MTHGGGAVKGLQRAGRLLIAVSLVGLSIWIVGRAAGAAGGPEFERWVGWSNVLALLVGAIGTALVLTERVRQAGGDRAGHVLADLARAVGTDLAREAVARQLRQPAPIMIRWSSTARAAAGRDVVLGTASGRSWKRMPLTGNVSTVAKQFLELPRRQLMVLGAPGAGKTVLAMEFALQLLELRVEGDAVPVVLPVSSWEPKESLEDFIVRRVDAGEDDITTRRLLQDKLLIPVLDGLDELPGGRLAQALTVVSRYAAEGRPLVVTCRAAEYDRAIAESGEVVAAAAVIEIEPVTLDAVIEFLSEPAPSRHRWEPVFAYLRANPDSALAAALSTPLMVNVARIAYRDPTSRPESLLAVRNAEAVVGRLLDTFLDTVYEASRRPRRWLGFLAYDLSRTDSREIEWWRLGKRPLRGRRRFIRRLAAVFVLVTVVVVGFRAGGWWGAAQLGAAVVIAGKTATSEGFRRLWPASWPPASWTSNGNGLPSRIFGHLRLGLACGLALGLAFSEVFSGAAVGLGAGTVAAVFLGVRPPNVAPRSRAPTHGFWSNARQAVLAGISYATLGLIGAAAWARFEVVPRPLLLGGMVAATFGLIAAATAGGATWLRFRVVHLSLVRRGYLPWRLWTFLDDAYRRGVLRRSGTAYEFRHVLLQNHLARQAAPDILRRLARGGDRVAADELADVLSEQGDLAGAADTLKRSVGAFDVKGAEKLAGLLVAMGAFDELRRRATPGRYLAFARRYLRWAGQVDDSTEDANPYENALVAILAERGDLAGLRTLADKNRSPNAGAALADLLADHGDRDELRSLAEARDWAAARKLATLLESEGDLSGAADLRHRLSRAGDRDSSQWMSRFLLAHADASDAIAFAHDQITPLRASSRRLVVDTYVRAGDVDGAVAFLRSRGRRIRDLEIEWLADLLAVHGRIDELRELAAGRGHKYAHAADRLATVLLARGAVNELRSRSDAGCQYAAVALLDLLQAQGRINDIRTMTSRHEQAGDRLATLLARQGDIEGLRDLATRGNGSATRHLADALARSGDLSVAIGLLRTRVSNGDGIAAFRLAALLAQHERVAEGVEIVQERAQAGDDAAKQILPLLTIEHGYTDDVVDVLNYMAAQPENSWRYDYVERYQAGRLAAAGDVAELRRRAEGPERKEAEPAAIALAGLLARTGEPDAALDVLRPWVDRGLSEASEPYALLLATTGRNEELESRASLGDWEAWCYWQQIPGNAGRSPFLHPNG
ncbi:NACHT domain-containing protein [Plantactinospora sp. WMMB334]|uniref:NACHT domain-containing protein n=1 Tax=Plantactinospora sp. WMMB334 TaxID=3404119 RepID=UPI003B9496AC